MPRRPGRTEFLLHIHRLESVRASAKDNRNARTTDLYWLRKTFAALEGCQDGVRLSGRVWLDETYFSLKPKDEERRTDGKLYAGLSRNQVCVGTAVDGEGGLLLAVLGKGKPTGEEILKAFSTRIEPGSVLVHDGENSHRALVETLSLKEEVHASEETAGLKDSENPKEPVNAVHRHLKEFMRSHSNFCRGDLPGWLDLFWMIRRYPDEEEFAKAVIARAFLSRKTVRYRSATTGKR